MSGDPKLFVFPGNIEPEILEAGAGQVPYARTDSFGTVILEMERHVLDLLGCSGGRLVQLTASGTAAMEAAVANLSGETKRSLVIDGGTFGRRWAEMLSLYPHAKVDVVKVPFGKDPEYPILEAKLESGEYHALYMQHHETSSGALFDVARLGSACRRTGTLLVVDAISSFLADSLSMDDFGIDAAIISSHKGLCLPPGLSCVALGPRMLKQPFRRCNAYLDFTENLSSLERGQPLFTPAVQIYLQMHRRLQGLSPDRGAACRAAVREKATAFRALLQADNREQVPASPSYCLSSFLLKCSGKDVSTRLAEKGWFIMPSSQPNQVRVSHLGCCSIEDHHLLYENIQAAEQDVLRG